MPNWGLSEVAGEEEGARPGHRQPLAAGGGQMERAGQEREPGVT